MTSKYPLTPKWSQIVGTQAALNVMTGERYKSITTEVKNYFLGQYGKAPGKINTDIEKKAIGDQKPIAYGLRNDFLIWGH